MPITPSNQIRFVDPYERIVSSNAINQQFSKVLLANKSIIRGCLLQVLNATTLNVTSGVVVVDKTVIYFPTNVTVSLSGTSYTAGTENVVFVHYEYELNVPLNRAYIDLVDISSFNFMSEQDVVLGFATIDSSGSLVSVSDTDGSGLHHREQDARYWRMFLYNLFDPQKYPAVSVIASINGQNIINEPDPVNDLDLANKRYVDNVMSTTLPDELVKVDSNEADSSYFGGLNKGQYLYEQLSEGDNISYTVNTLGGGVKQIEVSKTNNKVRIRSGDSKGGFKCL